MRRYKVLRRVTGIFLVIALLLSPFQLQIRSLQVVLSEIHADYDVVGDPFLIEQDTVWTKNQELSFNKRVVIVNGASLTITEGARVILGSDEPDFPFGSVEVNDGALRVLGTEREPVTFSGRDHKPFSLDFYTFELNRPESFIRYAVIGEGGDVLEDGGGSAFFPKWLVARAFAAGNGAAALNYGSGRLHIENTRFANEYHPNVVIQNAATFSDLPGEYLRIINSNFANKTDQIAVQSALSCTEGEACQNKVTLKNNWFGAATGPKGVSEQNPVGMLGNGSAISGPVMLDGFRKKELIADPAIVVPGITGSALVLGTWKLDPILHSYDDLIASLETNGYESEMNLFTFPYDWRRDNETSAHSLQGKVEDVQQSSGVSRVDLVAHSMGGLVARAYIEAVGGALYNDTVDQLVTLGTPNSGSPEAYLKWEAGEGFFTLKENLAKHHFEQESEEAGFNNNLKGYIRERVPSIGQLLPDYNYLVDASDTAREYPTNYPQNDFLEELNSERNTDELAAVNYINIVGLTNPENTISTLRVVESTVDSHWEHGMPENFYDVETDRGLKFGAGDETVPERSVKAVEADTVVEISSTHGELPTKAQCEVFKVLTAQEECTYKESTHIPNIILFDVFSPIDIQIVSPSGKRVGKNFTTGGFVNEIPGAYYTGSDTENEFVTIPHPEQGEYKILKQGTGAGEYRVEAIHIEERAGEALESVATTIGIAEENVVTESTVELKETGEVVAEDVGDTISPVTTPSFSGTLGTNGWYKSDVTVTLSATDNEGASGVAKTEYSVDGGTTWSVYTEPLVLTEEGNVALQYFSTDTAGNKEAIKTETIKIDKTAPEAKIMFNHTTQKLDVLGSDKNGGNVASILIEQKRDIQKNNAKLQNVKPWFERWWRIHGKRLPDMLAVLTDEAGHTTTVFFEKSTGQKAGSMTLRVKSLTYDDGREYLVGATSQYDWQLDKSKEYQQLMTRLGTSSKTLESRYRPQNHETWIRERILLSRPDYLLREKKKEKDEDKSDEWQKFPGLVVPYLVTNKGQIEAVY